MFDLITAAWLGVLGACVGSFLNVVAYRMPRGMSVVWQPSHCPRCEHPIRARDNIPVLGWLALGGRCRDCGGPISPRYALVEALVGGIFFALAYIELFSAGANLPGGPFSENQGALFTVWYPNWPLLGLYFYHAAGASILTAMVLIGIDGTRIPTTFAMAAMGVGLAAPMTPWVVGSALAEDLGIAMTKIVAAALVAGLLGRLVPRWDARSLILATVTAVLFLPNDLGKLGLFAAVLLGWSAIVMATARNTRYYPGAILAAWLVALLG